MDWIRNVPIGQYVQGHSGWMRRIDPRLKMAWVLMFLLTPILAAHAWRIGLVLSLACMTILSGIPVRVWWRSFRLVILLSVVVGLLATFLPTGEPSATLSVRSAQEIPNTSMATSVWELIRIGPLSFGEIDIGPLVIDRRSADLGVNTSTLIFTVLHSVNLLMLTTSPEDLMWSLNWMISPLSFLGLPIDRLSFQLLLALRFLPLVQEEFQNLLRSLATRSVNLRRLGFKAGFALALSVCERFLANVLLRAEQGADAFLVRGGELIPPDQLRPKNRFHRNWLNIGSAIVLVFVISIRGKYGTL